MKPPPVVRVRAPAKINLTLQVGPVRTDGFHDLATVYQAIDLFDEVRAEPRPDAVVSVESRDAAGRPVPGVVDDAGNLAARAAAALRQHCGVASGVHLRVRKEIPVAAGLAGGSADAAATLVACDLLWGLGADCTTLLDLAATLGSDVPFALVGGTALGTGRGEHVQQLAAAPTTWLMVSSSPGLSTPAVYARTDQLRAGKQPLPPLVGHDVLGAVQTGGVDRLAAVLSNDLEPAAIALRPGLADVLSTGRAAGAAGGLVSGSGPTLLFLVRDDVHAEQVAAAVAPVVTARLPGARLSTVHGPVPGAAKQVVTDGAA